MVLVVVSTTVSMYAGMEGELKQRYPSDISVYSWYKEVPDDVNLDDALKEAAADSDKIIADSACNVKTAKATLILAGQCLERGQSLSRC